MNIKMQCCGIVIMLVLYYFYRKQRRIELNTVKAFSRVFGMTFICIVLDILSVVAIVYMESIPMLLVELVCKGYLTSLLLMCLFAILYICVDVYEETMYKKAIIKYTLYVAAGIIALLVLPIQYFCDKETGVVYTYGSSVIAAYITNVGFVAAIFLLMWKKKSNINAKRRDAVSMWLLTYIMAAVVQFFVPELLLVGYAATVGMMVLYLKLENPEMNLDRQSGLFNQNAWIQYTKQMNEKKKNVSLLFMYLSREDNSIQMREEAVMEVFDFLAELPDTLVFRYQEGRMILVFKEPSKAEELMRILKERGDRGYGKNGRFNLKREWIYLPDSTMIKDTRDMVRLIEHIRKNNKEFFEGETFVVTNELIEQVYYELEMERTVKEAIDEGRIEVFYQPIYSTKERRFTSAEALVRIRDKEGKIVPPGAFIRIAEENGMILSIGEIVFRKVCQFIKENDMKQCGLDYIEVNLSVVQCAYQNLANDFIGIMEEYGVESHFINLEITESASLKAKKTLLENMERLMDYGVHFSLDDFGTGQSNLNYIVDMPVSIVKFDRDMTNAYFENGKAKYVMDAAMHMIHGMQLEIVSEGVETKAQYEEMESLGISYIQGYYFSKPLPEKEFLQYIKAAG